jgi:hypothetical protein
MALRTTGRAFVAGPIRRALLLVLGVAGDGKVDGVFHRVRHARDLQAQNQAQDPHRHE